MEAFTEEKEFDSFGISTASLILMIIFPPYGFIRSQQRKRPPVQAPPNILSIERLYRYNVLYTRAKLLKYCTGNDAPHFTDNGMTSMIQNDLNQHSKAINDYYTIRNRSGWIFGKVRLEPVTLMMGKIETLESELGKLPPQSDEAQRINQQIWMVRKEIETSLSMATRSGILEHEISTAKQRLWVRLMMAVGGGFALVIPMLIMVLNPSWITNLITTVCSVFVVAVGLAVSMTSSEPKDIVACTAAYAAVLVVFVGTGGGA